MKHYHLKNIFLCLCLFGSINAFAYDAEIDGIYYNFLEENAEVVSGTYSGVVAIPASVTYKDATYNVTTIANKAFYGCKKLKSVTLPEGVTRIGNEAFYGCDSLISVNIPEGVTDIGNDAFVGCKSLIAITIPASVTSINNNVFKGCYFASDNFVDKHPSTNTDETTWSSGATICDVETEEGILITSHEVVYSRPRIISAIIPTDVTSIGDHAFYNRGGLTSVTIPSSVTNIAASSFCWCTGLTFVTLPEGVVSIGDYAFYKCSNLNSVTIPASVTNIGHDAFSFCRNLTSVTIPGNVEDIRVSTFYDCSGLTSVTLPESVTSIESSAFSGCYNLTSVNIPNSVTSIGNYAFNGCSGMTSFNLPDQLTSIGENSFFGCIGLNSITIPASVTSIGNDAFADCKNLKAVNITDLTAWCNISFESSFSQPLTCAHQLYLNGQEITELVIPEEVTNIGDYAFAGCTGLSTVTILEGVASIGQGVFADCTDLGTVTIPASMGSIGNNAFSNCTGLMDIYCYAVTPPAVAANTFSNVDVNTVQLFVPSGSEDQYLNNSVWKNFIIMSGDNPDDGAPDGIDFTRVDAQTASEAYDLNGRKQNAFQHGLNLVRMNDGTVRKVLVK